MRQVRALLVSVVCVICIVGIAMGEDLDMDQQLKPIQKDIKEQQNNIETSKTKLEKYKNKINELSEQIDDSTTDKVTTTVHFDSNFNIINPQEIDYNTKIVLMGEVDENTISIEVRTFVDGKELGIVNANVDKANLAWKASVGPFEPRQKVVFSFKKVASLDKKDKDEIKKFITKYFYTYVEHGNPNEKEDDAHANKASLNAKKGLIKAFNAKYKDYKDYVSDESLSNIFLEEIHAEHKNFEQLDIQTASIQAQIKILKEQSYVMDLSNNLELFNKVQSTHCLYSDRQWSTPYPV